MMKNYRFRLLNLFRKFFSIILTSLYIMGISTVWLGLIILTKGLILFFIIWVLWIYRLQIWEGKGIWIPQIKKVYYSLKDLKKSYLRLLLVILGLLIIIFIPPPVSMLFPFLFMFIETIMHFNRDIILFIRLICFMFIIILLPIIYNPVSLIIALIGLMIYKWLFYSIILVVLFTIVYLSKFPIQKVSFRKFDLDFIKLSIVPCIIGLALFPLFYHSLLPLSCEKYIKYSHKFSDSSRLIRGTFYSIDIMGGKLYAVDCLKWRLAELDVSLKGKLKYYKFPKRIMGILSIPEQNKLLITSPHGRGINEKYTVFLVDFIPKFKNKLIEACPAPLYFESDKEKNKIYTICTTWISILDKKNFRLQKTIPLELANVYGYAIDWKRRNILIGGASRNGVVYDLDEFKVKKILPRKFDVSVAFDSIRNRYYIAKSIPPCIEILDGKNFKRIGRMWTPIYRKIFFDEYTGLLMAGGFVRRTVDIIDPEKKQILVKLPTGPYIRAFKQAQKKGNIYVATSCGIYNVNLHKAVGELKIKSQ